MRNKRDIRQPRNNRSILIMLAMTVVIVILIFSYISQTRGAKFNYLESDVDVDITFFDNSINKENPSGKVSINDEVVYTIDSISKCLTKDKIIKLKKGIYYIRISTLNDECTLYDTIEIINYHHLGYDLLIDYKSDKDTIGYFAISFWESPYLD